MTEPGKVDLENKTENEADNKADGKVDNKAETAPDSIPDSIPDSNTSELLKALDIMMRDITPEQMQKLQRLATTVDPQNLKPEEALRIVKESGIDIEELQRRSRVERFKQRVKKIPPNSICSCGSQKKYKKCCGSK